MSTNSRYTSEIEMLGLDIWHSLLFMFHCLGSEQLVKCSVVA